MQNNAPRRIVPLKCIDTGDFFPSIRAAADWLGITDQEFGQKLKTSDTIGQLRWEIVVVQRRRKVG